MEAASVSVCIDLAIEQGWGEGGVGGMACAHGNEAEGSTSREGVREVVACSSTVRMTSWGSCMRVPRSMRTEVREGRGAPLLSVEELDDELWFLKEEFRDCASVVLCAEGGGFVEEFFG